MRTFTTVVLSSTLAACSGSAPSTQSPEPAARSLAVDVYAGTTFPVNAYVVSDATSSILIDATRSSVDGRGVLALARKRGHEPSAVFITHGHPDHFLGLGALRAELPNLRIVVASEAIKQDLIGFAKWMDGQGWLEAEPGMKPSAFDYNSIEVLAEPKLRLGGGAVLDIKSDYAPNEAEHASTVYSKDLGALFTGDLTYHDVHMWLGAGVSHAHAKTWQDITHELERAYPETTTVYPGHGAPSNRALYAKVRTYIDDLLAIAKTTASDDAAIQAMVAKYPAHASPDFLLKMSVEHQRKLATKK